jgi:hypothetical protein
MDVSHILGGGELAVGDVEEVAPSERSSVALPLSTRRCTGTAPSPLTVRI